jgi:hypothetical protein
MYYNKLFISEKRVFLSDKEKLDAMLSIWRTLYCCFGEMRAYSSRWEKLTAQVLGTDLDFQYLEDIAVCKIYRSRFYKTWIKPQVDTLVGLNTIWAWFQGGHRCWYNKGGCRRKLEGVLSGLKTEMGRVMTQNSLITLLITDGPKPAENAAPSGRNKDWLKN